MVFVHQHQGVGRVIDGPGIIIGGKVLVQVDLGDDLLGARLRVGLGIGEIAGFPVQAAVVQSQTGQQPGVQPQGALPQPGPELLGLVTGIAQFGQGRQGGAIARGGVRLVVQGGQPRHRRPKAQSKDDLRKNHPRDCPAAAHPHQGEGDHRQHIGNRFIGTGLHFQ